jgi:hypothetical protein
MTRLLLLLLAALAAMVGRGPLNNRHDPDLPWWALAVLNAPQAVRGGKRHLLKWPRRGRRMRQLLRAHRIDLVGLQEVGLRTAEAFSGAGRWALHLATPNNKRGRWQVGNGILAWDLVVERLHRRTYRIRRGRLGWLNIPVHLYRDRITGDRVIFIAGHADRKRPDPTANRIVLERLAALGEWLHRVTGCAVVVVLDANNDGPADAIFDKAGAEHLAGEHIDKMYGWGVVWRNRRTLSGFHGDVTDHADPPAVDVAPADGSRNFTLTKIPSFPKEL